jgi:hypothetical protein
MLVIAGRIRVQPARREDAIRLALDVSRETVKAAAPTGSTPISRTWSLLPLRGMKVSRRWRSLATPHMARFMTEVPALPAGGIEINYEVSAVAPMQPAKRPFGFFAVRRGVVSGAGDEHPDADRRDALRRRSVSDLRLAACERAIYWDAASAWSARGTTTWCASPRTR